MRKVQLAQQPEDRGPLLLKAGAAHEAAGNDAAAIDAFQASLVLQKSIEALEAMDRLLGRTQRFAEQAEILDQLAELVPDPRSKKEYMLRRAALLQKEGQPRAAVSAYQQALGFFPREPALVLGLEQLLQQDAVKQEVGRILEPIYRSANDRQKLVEVLECKLLIAAPDKRFALRKVIAGSHEPLGHRASAFNAQLRAFSETPVSQTA